MRLILHLLIISLLAAGTGLGLTALAVRNPPALDVITAGPWQAIATEGSPAVDSYALAALARRGESPLAIADGLAFRATTDDSGRPIDGRCSYMIEGAVPPIRAWTLAAYDEAGNPFPNPADRYAFSSAEALRDAGGHIRIKLGEKARGGDWLPTSRGLVVLMLRLYDTTAGAIAGGRSAPELPSIRRVACPA